MSWSIKGTYFETCSCELMCPCNFSFDHGATYDYCRVTLVFNIREGDVEGTDVSGRILAVIADTPKVMTEGNWRLGMFVDDGTSDEQMEKLTAVFGGQMGGPMAGLAPLIGEVLGVERARDRGRRGRTQPQRPHRRRDRLRGRGHRPVRCRDGRAREAHRDLPSRRLRADRCGGEALERSARSGSNTKGKRGSPPRSPGPPEHVTATAHERAPDRGGARPPPMQRRARGSDSSRYFWRSPLSAGGGPRARCRTWTAARGRNSEPSPGSWACGS